MSDRLIVFQHNFHRQCLPQVKKRALLDSPHLSQNKKLFTFASTTRTESHGVITKRMNFNCPVVETSESIEANYYDLELSIVIPCTFLRSSNLNSLFGDRKLLASVCLLSLRWRKRKLKKKTKLFLCRGRFQSLVAAFRNTEHVGRARQNGPNRRRSKTFLRKYCGNKTSKLD